MLHQQLDVHADFSKAFDRVDRTIILNKLKFYGLNDELIELLASHLQNRQLIPLVSVRAGLSTGTFPIPAFWHFVRRSF
jgi:hypothetical protein